MPIDNIDFNKQQHCMRQISVYYLHYRQRHTFRGIFIALNGRWFAITMCSNPVVCVFLKFDFNCVKFTHLYKIPRKKNTAEPSGKIHGINTSVLVEFLNSLVRRFDSRKREEERGREKKKRLSTSIRYHLFTIILNNISDYFKQNVSAQLLAN